MTHNDDKGDDTVVSGGGSSSLNGKDNSTSSNKKKKQTIKAPQKGRLRKLKRKALKPLPFFTDTTSMSPSSAKRMKISHKRKRNVNNRDGVEQPKIQNGKLGGLVCYDNVDELTRLLHQQHSTTTTTNKRTNMEIKTSPSSSTLVGPSILLQQQQQQQQQQQSSSSQLAKDWIQTEGIHHRDIIHALLFHNGTRHYFPTITTLSPLKDSNPSLHHNEKEERVVEDNSDYSSSTEKKNLAIQKGDRHRKRMKRKSDKNRHDKNYGTIKIPEWAELHNPACCEGIIVIEFGVSSSSSSSSKEGKGKKDPSVNILPSRRLDISNIDSTSSYSSSMWHDLIQSEKGYGPYGRKALPTNVNLFDIPNTCGDNDSSNSNNNNSNSQNKSQVSAKNVTDVMMYLDGVASESIETIETKETMETNRISNATVSMTLMERIISLLEPFILDRNRMKKEGFYFNSNYNHHIGHTSMVDYDNDKEEEEEEDYENGDGCNVTRKKRIEALQNLEMVAERFDSFEKNKTCLSGHYDHSSMPFELSKACDIIQEFSIKIEGDEGFEQDEKDDGATIEDAGNNNNEKYVEELYVSTILSRVIRASITKPQHTLSSSTPNHNLTAPPPLPLASPLPSSPNIFAIDCEMVRTSKGPELARVTVLKLKPNETDYESYETVLDTYVKPRRPVLDYLTRFSGITPTILQATTIRIEQVQAFLLTLIKIDDICIGHSLENDLKALRLVHGRIVDTSVMFRGSNGRKYSLKHLSAVLLRRIIQQNVTGTSVGHCSEEDASASLSLAVRRATTGPEFRLKSKKGRGKSFFEAVSEYQRKLSSPTVLPSKKGNDNNDDNDDNDDDDDDEPTNQTFLSRVTGRPTVCIGPVEWIKHVFGRETQRHNDAHALTCNGVQSSTVNALSSWSKEGHRRAYLCWARLLVDGGNVDGSNKRIDEIMSKLLKDIPATTVVLVVFQRGYERAKLLAKQRFAAKDRRSTAGWSTSQEEAYLREVKRSKSCEAFWIGM